MRHFGLTGRRMALAAGVAGLALASTGLAEEISLEGFDDQARSAFTLDFGDGVPRVSEISFTEFDLRIDPTAGTAYMAYYRQYAAPLDLPTPTGGTLSTGDLIIEIVPGSSTGTYDADGQTFATNEDYVIYFTGDLSALGMTSPVILEGPADPTEASANGSLDSSDGLFSGDVNIDWSGTYELDFGGGFVVPLQYNCEVRADFSQFEGCNVTGCEAADLNRDCVVDLSDVSNLLANYGRTGNLVAQRTGDLDGDQDVDLSDLAQMLATYALDCN